MSLQPQVWKDFLNKQEKAETIKEKMINLTTLNLRTTVHEKILQSEKISCKLEGDNCSNVTVEGKGDILNLTSPWEA